MTYIVQHKTLGDIIWNVIGIDKDGNLVLFGAPLPEKRAFYNPLAHDKAHYVRIDFSSTQNGEGILLEVQNKDASLASQKASANRYNGIKEYGSNQWLVSDIREYLNNDFLSGLPESFQKCIIPQSHTLLLTQASYDSESRKGTQSSTRICSDGSLVYDVYDSDMLRKTYSVVQDSIYVPSVREIDHDHSKYFHDNQGLVQYSSPSSSTLVHFWMMDAYIKSSTPDPFLVNIVGNAYNLAGNPQSYKSSCNACTPLHICPMCVVAPECFPDAIPQIEEQTANITMPHGQWKWQAVDPSSVNRAKKCNSFSIDYDAKDISAVFVGSNGKYTVTLDTCTCVDFDANKRKQSPCKHMLRLGMEVGLINENGFTPTQQIERDIRSLYLTLYSPGMNDSKYDAIRDHLDRLTSEFENTK